VFYETESLSLTKEAKLVLKNFERLAVEEDNERTTGISDIDEHRDFDYYAHRLVVKVKVLTKLYHL
jgi:hypothetical protein